MASERDVFDLSGPLHLTKVDWENSDHRRSVAASLVQGVYILERDRQQKREPLEALAPAWWEFFHFKVIRELIDDADMSIFGAIYEFNPPNQSMIVPGAPRYVIAFRGTITKGDAFSRDFQLDLHCIQNGLHRTSRFELGMQAVRNITSAVGHMHVWLTGHSLGSAIATLAGKNMAKTGILIESFLFNPPFVSAPIERIKDKKIKHGIRIASSFITAGLAIAANARKGSPRSVDSFAILSPWVPSLFVNPADPICSEYIGYFEHRQRMEEMGVWNVERLATQNSIGDLFLNAIGKESDPLHLLPSANLNINLSPSPDFKRAHGIHQWFQPDVRLKSNTYMYK
ncbi:hypothetical protein ACLOJK_009903 [Asimina triloba]